MADVKHDAKVRTDQLAVSDFAGLTVGSALAMPSGSADKRVASDTAIVRP